jgi:hypothetical protein
MLQSPAQGMAVGVSVAISVGSGGTVWPLAGATTPTRPAANIRTNAATIKAIRMGALLLQRLNITIIVAPLHADVSAKWLICG